MVMVPVKNPVCGTDCDGWKPVVLGGVNTATIECEPAARPAGMVQAATPDVSGVAGVEFSAGGGRQQAGRG